MCRGLYFNVENDNHIHILKNGTALIGIQLIKGLNSKER